MTIPQIRIVHDALAQGDWIAAANLALRADEIDETVDTPALADVVIRTLLQNLYDEDLYLEASALLWSPTTFNYEPEVVQRIFKALHEENRLLIMGGSSLSKTFSAGVFFYHEWRRDPLYTAIKLVAVSEDHLRKNLHSHIAALHRNAAIPMKEDILIRDTDLYIGIKDWLAEFGISGLAVKQNVLASGSLRGHKPKPYRKIEHPRFGHSSRVRVLVDEAQNVPIGAFEDLKTIEASISGPDLVKLCVCFNPIGMNVHPVIMATPPDGWAAEQLETLYDYTSKFGWRVLRLDGAKFENVIQRKNIYANMLTHEAYIGFLSAGDNSAAYYALGRGFPPLQDSAYTIIPAAWMHSQRGEPLFIDKVFPVASIDIALQGGDKAVLGVGRWGLASGWRRFNNEVIFFEDQLSPGKRKPRWVLVIDQLFKLPKTEDTVTMGQEIMGRCKTLMIEPKWVAIDATGNSVGVYSYLKRYWGDVLGVFWNHPSTESLILHGDQAPASEVYDGLPSEMWYATKRWLDPVINSLLFNQILGDNPLGSKIGMTMQLTSRQVDLGKWLKVQNKETWRGKNGGCSPDEADVVVQMVHLVRMRGGVLPGLGADTNPERAYGSAHGKPIALKPEKSADSLEPLDFGAEGPRGGIELDT